ncbi:hypothetical protein G5714_004617 [Onychostoma macrolepis]|uniref:C-type lectin domain-containing protein n=1 Tax=Onychostoma macrolepis TaxID=369639 RepID=A0A7J6D5Z8_9TELE|nr:hypothetical protein G5714_004617 [Onychostoma macrolepis]
MFTDGWIYYQFSFYYVSNETKNWTESRRYCTERGADLVIIKNSEKQDLVKKISCGSEAWIGLTASDEESKWKWVDGSTLSSGFWRPGEPNRHLYENCTIITLSGVWADYLCTNDSKWICNIRCSFFVFNQRTVGENATSTEVACGSSMTTTVSGKHDDAFKYKIITLKAEITLLKDECDFLKKEIEKMKSAVPSAMAQRYTVPIVPQPSASLRCFPGPSVLGRLLGWCCCDCCEELLEQLATRERPGDSLERQLAGGKDPNGPALG